MVDPITLSIVEMVGEPAAKQLMEWAKGSEANQLVKLLKPRFPNAYKLLTQPSVLVEIYVYAESGVFRQAEMVRALRAITDSPQQAAELAEAIRENQWRVMRDDRQAHQELRRLRAEIGGDISTGNSELLQGITEAIERLALRLPAARQLPAQTSPFVDRDRELADGQSKLATASTSHVAMLVNCTGMAGAGKSAFALELAYRQPDRFDGGVLYVDMRSTDGRVLSAGDVAARLLRDLGVGPDAIPEDPGRRLALWRSMCATDPVLVVLDNAQQGSEVQRLIPANGDCVVLVTSRMPLQGLAGAALIELAEMAQDDALQLLEVIVGDRVRSEVEAAREIVASCSGLPLALTVVAGRLWAQPARTLASMAEALAASDDLLGGLDDRAGSIRATLASSMGDAGSEARRVLLLLAALDVSDLEPALVAAVAGCDTGAAEALLQELGEQRLITPVAGGGWRINDLLRLAASQLAVSELGEREILSAQEHKVRWVVETAEEHANDLEGGE
ncbi:MAG TPA: NB-ARC domain-containing protein [Solirubrobacteraceae bacterium]|nr:NB-ARC domain-containing protein [Solirubrobacteraceae bacterium]